MAMYMCPNCGVGVSSGDNHKCKQIPFNVLNIRTSKKCPNCHIDMDIKFSFGKKVIECGICSYGWDLE